MKQKLYEAIISIALAHRATCVSYIIFTFLILSWSEKKGDGCKFYARQPLFLKTVGGIYFGKSDVFFGF